ncbi:hypothetical protein GCM10010515_70600 [Streptomyces fructofermentans]|uniref:Uncharacterized protein n=1 Tax=Streptomyces fructofermentans TaxID=152141 RepID=A0A918NSY6_9ACTN|nr:hypothetical protein GCM10010515_70600 [Streptomyces fructofermentans]
MHRGRGLPRRRDPAGGGPGGAPDGTRTSGRRARRVAAGAGAGRPGYGRTGRELGPPGGGRGREVLAAAGVRRAGRVRADLASAGGHQRGAGRLRCDCIGRELGSFGGRGREVLAAAGVRRAGRAGSSRGLVGLGAAAAGGCWGHRRRAGTGRLRGGGASAGRAYAAGRDACERAGPGGVPAAVCGAPGVGSGPPWGG